VFFHCPLFFHIIMDSDFSAGSPYCFFIIITAVFDASDQPLILSFSGTTSEVFSAPVAAAFSIFFFFQAEDGIRDDLVTGVQTCALPILPRMNATSALPNDEPAGRSET